jgi:hypothetical protein
MKKGLQAYTSIGKKVIDSDPLPRERRQSLEQVEANQRAKENARVLGASGFSSPMRSDAEKKSIAQRIYKSQSLEILNPPSDCVLMSFTLPSNNERASEAILKVLSFQFKSVDLAEFEEEYSQNYSPAETLETETTVSTSPSHTDNELPNQIEPERIALNFFHKEGDIWHIGFGGKEINIKHFSGLQYIAYLLEKPGTSISYNKLNQITSRATNALSVGAAINEGLNVGRSSQAAADNEARTAYIKKYKQLGVDLDNTEDTPEGAMLREEIEKDMASLQSAISERALPDKETKNLQSNIQKNIKRAYDAIEETELKDLAAYLQTYIQPGGSYDLSYTGVAVWEIIL